jgi:hypothetical protein
MKKPKLKTFILFTCFAYLIISCQEEDPIETGVPGNDQIYYLTFELDRIDSAWYWGDSEKIRLQSGVIMLNPYNHTYFRRFNGTADEALDPAQVKWSKEESGKYVFSADSSYVLFSEDPDPLFYFPGNLNNGIYHPPRLEQYDSVWYSISYFSMAVSGRFVYSGKAN